MQIRYTNRKGQTCFLCCGITKTGKPRYYFAREPQDTPVHKIPAGYEIKESVNGVVSLAKARPTSLFEAEIEAVTTAIQAHPQAKDYRTDAKSKVITVYEKVGPDVTELAIEFATQLGIEWKLTQGAIARLEEQDRTRSQYSPIMRFTLTEESKRLFKAERMRFSGEVNHWMNIDYNKPISVLASSLIPTLGTDEFFELF